MNLEDLKYQFTQAANRELAVKMQTYMKNKFVFFGIPAAKRKSLSQPFIRLPKFSEEELVIQMVNVLWQLEQREFHYTAIDLLIRHKKNLSTQSVPMLESLLSTNAWWDSVDLIASHCVGSLVKRNPQLGSSLIRRWRDSQDIWFRRACLIYQLKYKAETNISLLSEVVLENQNDTAFFIQKAIGWALREYSKINPDWVINFVAQQKITGLAKREALKHF